MASIAEAILCSTFSQWSCFHTNVAEHTQPYSTGTQCSSCCWFCAHPRVYKVSPQTQTPHRARTQQNMTTMMTRAPPPWTTNVLQPQPLIWNAKSKFPKSLGTLHFLQPSSSQWASPLVATLGIDSHAGRFHHLPIQKCTFAGHCLIYTPTASSSNRTGLGRRHTLIQIASG